MKHLGVCNACLAYNIKKIPSQLMKYQVVNWLHIMADISRCGEDKCRLFLDC